MENQVVLKQAASYSKEFFQQCWKLISERGRQIWYPENLPSEINDDFLEQLSEAFIYNKKLNPNSGDKIFRNKAGIPIPEELKNNKHQKVFKSAYKAIHYFQSLQAEDGHFPGDYGGPMFLTPGLIIASYVTETPLHPVQRTLIKRYMLNHQNEDGGWGLHLEGNSTMFGTVLQYVALRILGMNKSDKEIVKAGNWIRQNGGATGIPSWGKFYLSVLGCYEWDGCNSLLPEMWLFPKWLPVHPWRYWCHARMVYLPMSYCYGHRFTGKITPLVQSLRNEIYTEPYEKIDWRKARNHCAETDLYYPQSRLLKLLSFFINLYEKFPVQSWRKKALSFILEYIHAEDRQTNYIDIGPVNQAINSICIFHACGKDSPQFQQHKERWNDYLWLAEDGMKMNGYNGSQLWDTAFAAQAIAEGGMEKYFPETTQKAYHFIDISQIQTETENREKFFRHIQIGGWPFSTLEHGWPITDCTAEGLKAILTIHKTGRNKHSSPVVSNKRLFDAVNVILSFQNSDGSWATYELTRGPVWLELLNPSEIFGGIMIDYGYTECTSACVQALIQFQEQYPNHRKNEIDSAVENGINFILKQQQTDGSWYGSWAVCFTYGTWFGVEALAAFQKIKNSEKINKALQKAKSFLLSKQNDDGGWGEKFESCVHKKYVPHEQSQVVNTSWALLSLMAVNNSNNDEIIIEKGIQFLLNQQHENGDWQQQSINGVFNHNCMITYSNYRNIFPIWALSRYLKS
jgi:squalene/oxidosqualene cyclase-like protein